MQRTSFREMDCSVAQCLEVVGEWWSMLIVRDAFFGVRRFDDFQTSLGISRNILNQRLTRLVDEGVLKRVRYHEHPPRDEYRLTDKGRDLWAVLTAMRQWGDTWASPEGPRLVLEHKDCGHIADAVPTCSECGGQMGPGNVRAHRGPGTRSGRAERALSHLVSDGDDRGVGE